MPRFTVTIYLDIKAEDAAVAKNLSETWGVLATTPSGPTVAYFGPSEDEARKLHDQNKFFMVSSRLVKGGKTVEEYDAEKAKP